MRKFLLTMTIFGSFFFINPELSAQEMGGGGTGGFECKTEVIICNWFWGTTRQICHQNGNGVSCLCGSSTNCP